MAPQHERAVTSDGGWQLGPFRRRGTVLRDVPEVTFRCPVSGRTVAWAAKDVFNPGATVYVRALTTDNFEEIVLRYLRRGALVK